MEAVKAGAGIQGRPFRLYVYLYASHVFRGSAHAHASILSYCILQMEAKIIVV